MFAQMKEERFRKMFAAFGTLTDCGLKFTKDGKFRKFGFVGFKSEEDAEKALKHFNKSFVDTSRVTVSVRSHRNVLFLRLIFFNSIFNWAALTTCYPQIHTHTCSHRPLC